jgi:hypothetical protein
MPTPNLYTSILRSPFHRRLSYKLRRREELDAERSAQTSFCGHEADCLHEHSQDLEAELRRLAARPETRDAEAQADIASGVELECRRLRHQCLALDQEYQELLRERAESLGAQARERDGWRLQLSAVESDKAAAEQREQALEEALLELQARLVQESGAEASPSPVAAGAPEEAAPADSAFARSSGGLESLEEASLRAPPLIQMDSEVQVLLPGVSRGTRFYEAAAEVAADLGDVSMAVGPPTDPPAALGDRPEAVMSSTLLQLPTDARVRLGRFDPTPYLHPAPPLPLCPFETSGFSDTGGLAMVTVTEVSARLAASAVDNWRRPEFLAPPTPPKRRGPGRPRKQPKPQTPRRPPLKLRNSGD